MPFWSTAPKAATSRSLPQTAATICDATPTFTSFAIVTFTFPTPTFTSPSCRLTEVLHSRRPSRRTAMTLPLWCPQSLARRLPRSRPGYLRLHGRTLAGQGGHDEFELVVDFVAAQSAHRRADRGSDRRSGDLGRPVRVSASNVARRGRGAAPNRRGAATRGGSWPWWSGSRMVSRSERCEHGALLRRTDVDDCHPSCELTPG